MDRGLVGCNLKMAALPYKDQVLPITTLTDGLVSSKLDKMETLLDATFSIESFISQDC